MGGVELHVNEVARRLAAHGVAVTVLTTDLSGALPPRETVDGFSVVRVRAWPRQRDYYLAPGLVAHIRGGAWDVVHVQGYQTFVAPLAMAAAWRARLPYVLTFHGGGHSSTLRERLRPLQLKVLRPLLVRADRLIAVAPHEVDLYANLLQLPRARFAVISNGSDLTPARPNVVRDPSLVASLGRLEHYKGHGRVLDALPHLLERRPDVRLWIAGRGPEEAALRAKAASLGVADRVEIGAVPLSERAELARRLAGVKVAVSMSEFETQPIAMLEALALGCRVVVARTPGLAELADQGLARGVALGSEPAALAATIAAELELPTPDEPPQLPTWDDCAAALLRLYETVTCR